MLDFDYTYRSVLCTDTEAVLQCNGDYDGDPPDFIHVQLAGGKVEMNALSMKYGGEFIGNIESVRPSRR